MDDATRSAESMKEYITGLKNRFITVDAAEKCAVCSFAILTRQFYVFPCHHTFHADCLVGLTKEYLPAHVLRRLLALQDEIVKGKATLLDRGDGVLVDNGTIIRQSGVQKAPNFGVPAQNGHRQANSIGRNILSAGDRLRDLIMPDALVTVITSPAGWIPGIGGGQRNVLAETDTGKRLEKLRSELEDILASTCPLCESVIAGLDKPFTKAESDTTWEV